MDSGVDGYACFACHNQKSLQPMSNNPGLLLDEFEELKRRILQSKWGHTELAPILAFPNEITMLIFNLACDRSRLLFRQRSTAFGHFEEQEQHISEGAQELTISHVCHAWREISLDYSVLWSTINHFPKSPVGRLTDRLTTYLARAQANLMDLWAHVSGLDDLQCLLKILQLCSSRWRRISLTFDEHSMCRLPTRTVQLKRLKIFRNLETFDIYHPGGVDIGVDIDLMTESGQICTMATIGPRLTSLRVDHRLFLQSLRLRAPKIHQNCLSHLQLESGSATAQRLPWSSFLLILAEFTKLVSLSLSSLIFDPPRRRPRIGEINAIVAPNLQYFRCADKEVAVWMWLYFRAPRLKFLTFNRVTLRDHHLRNFRYVVHDMHEQIFPSLETLTFANCFFHFVLSADGMRPIIDATRNITHLKISGSPSTLGAQETPIHWMSQVMPQEKVWPHLDTISIAWRRPIANADKEKPLANADTEIASVSLERMTERMRLLNQRCVLRTFNYLAREWKVKNHLQLPSVPGEAATGFWLTEWPPVDNTNFHWTSETSFAS
ncbi:hypothetical protein HYPSUDRAFT_1034140 [Hypholoma sublateritium FD-334 SS-4]|uniref:F-box domain-containing protein n=1 Tax=Hypholoma sublateritium (strain FD-334 SS-4) TaxID=945553 RepID=A0A0D2PE75_HYPSF|nr:hypothetical protein HYPSUDRAFT_1034140 [Hypholoma sublateritium FD-334 SS-4]